MKADTHTIKDLFQKPIRYVVPTFQRPYVWNQDDQWEPLWEDIRNTAERYLEAREGASSPEVAEEKTGRHFLGAVVLKQRPTPTAATEEREVIDGQQRVTTLQIVMRAIGEALEELGHEAEATRMKRLTENPYVTGDEVFKLWPTTTDQPAFRSIMTSAREEVGEGGSRLGEAFDYFQLQVTEWIRAGASEEERNVLAHGLETALMGLMEMVVIDLGTADDAFVIFETLNARGTPLLASDLVKNLVMQVAEAEGLGAEAIHQELWVPFEDPWWRKEIRQGRLTRPRIDVLLDYWLELRLKTEVPSHELFPRFKQHLEAEGNAVRTLLSDLVAVGQVWRSFDEEREDPREGTFVHRWRTIEAGPVTPLALRLFGARRTGDIDEADFHSALSMIESYLVRRMLCRMTTKDYNRLFIELLRQVDTAEPSQARQIIGEFLGAQQADARSWPTDGEVRRALRDLPIYRLITRARLRLVLEAIEESLRGPRTEDHVIPRKLTVEHVLPQSWKEHWSPPAGDDPVEALEERARRLHSIGNLTLVTKSLNPALSNAPWSDKRAALHEHSNLLMTRRLLDDAGDTWTDEQIDARSAHLADLVCQIWPRSDAP